MTKKRAREFLQRAREDLDAVEAALKSNDWELYEDAVMDALGAVSVLQEFLDSKGTAQR